MGLGHQDKERDLYVQAVVGAPLDVSEQENNVMKTAIESYPTEGNLAVFLKHNGRVLNFLLSLISRASWCLTSIFSAVITVQFVS